VKTPQTLPCQMLLPGWCQGSFSTRTPWWRIVIYDDHARVLWEIPMALPPIWHIKRPRRISEAPYVSSRGAWWSTVTDDSNLYRTHQTALVQQSWGAKECLVICNAFGKLYYWLYGKSDIHLLCFSGTRSSPGQEHCVVFLGKTIYSCSASLHPGV